MIKKTLVVGAGVSGGAAYDFLLKRNIAVDLLEDSRKGSVNLADYDKIVLSSGVPPDISLVVDAKKMGLCVIAEADLGLLSFPNPKIGITGSNGKTTTVMLVAFVLNYYGQKAACVGNIGNAICAYDGPRGDYGY